MSGWRYEWKGRKGDVMNTYFTSAPDLSVSMTVSSNAWAISSRDVYGIQRFKMALKGWKG